MSSLDVAARAIAASARSRANRWDFPDVADLIASDAPPAGAGKTWRAASYAYVEADAEATDYDLQTVGGVKLYAPAEVRAVLPLRDGSEDVVPIVNRLFERYDHVDVGRQGDRFLIGSVLYVAPGKTLSGLSTLTAADAMYALGDPWASVIFIASDATLRGITLECNSAGQVNDAIDGIRIDGSTGANVIEVTVRDSTGPGLQALNSDKLVIARSQFLDSMGHGMWIRATNGNTFEDIRVEGCEIDLRGVAPVPGKGVGGIKLAGASPTGRLKSILICHNTVRLPETTIDGSICIEAWGDVADINLVGNSTSGGQMGISLNKTVGGVMAANSCRHFTTIGLELAQSSHCLVSANNVDGRSSGGVNTGVTGISINNCPNIGSSIPSGNVGTDNIVRGLKEKGFHIYQSVGVKLTGGVCDLAGCLTTATAIYAQSSSRYHFDAMTLHGDSTAANAVFLDDSPDGAITNNQIEGFSGHMVKPYSNSSLAYSQLRIEDNNGRSVTGGFVQFVGSATIFDGCDFGERNVVDGDSAHQRTHGTTSVTLSHWHREANFSPSSDIVVSLPTGVRIGQRHLVRKRSAANAAAVDVISPNGNIGGRSKIRLDRTWTQVEAQWNGSEWTIGGTPPRRSGTVSGSTNASGDIVILHHFGATPETVSATPVGTAFAAVQVHSISTTDFKLRFFDASGAPLMSTAVQAKWSAS